ncbi:MAG TPA: GNAT family N-acetyltransferase [Chthoniobacter sp.]|jgi:ribosomal protein S18 acetylase RimI-like enzyme
MSNPTLPSGDDAALRPATTGDDEFLYRVYAGTRAEELALTNWTDAQKEQFCRMQFRAQSTDYAANYPAAQYSIIEHRRTAVGRLIVDRRESEINIVDIALLPDARGAGIGTRYLRELMDESRRAGKPLSIHVEKFNRALRLYHRLGFQPVADKGVYLLMEWKSPAAAPQ